MDKLPEITETTEAQAVVHQEIPVDLQEIPVDLQEIQEDLQETQDQDQEILEIFLL